VAPASDRRVVAPSPLELAWTTVRAVRAAGGELRFRRGHGPPEPAWVATVRSLDAPRHLTLRAELNERRGAVVELLRWEDDWERSGWDEARVDDHIGWAVRRYGQLGGAWPAAQGAVTAALSAIERARAARSPGDVWRACFDLLALAAGAEPEGGG
jgi:hypothetical protein